MEPQEITSLDELKNVFESNKKLVIDFYDPRQSGANKEISYTVKRVLESMDGGEASNMAFLKVNVVNATEVVGNYIKRGDLHVLPAVVFEKDGVTIDTVSHSYEVTSLDELNKIRKSNKKLVIDFYDPYGKSGANEQMFHTVKMMVGLGLLEASDIVFVKVNLENAREVMQEYIERGDLTVEPAVVLEKDGLTIDTVDYNHMSDLHGTLRRFILQ